MKFFEKIFGKKEIKQETEALDLDIFQLEKNLNEKLKIHSEPFDNEIKNKFSILKSKVSELEEKLKILEKSIPKKPVDSQLLQNTVAHRRSFLNRMNNLVRELKKPFDGNINKAYNSYVFSINSTNAKTLDDYKIIEEIFERESEEVINSFKSLHQYLTEIGKSLSNRNDSVLAVEESLENLRELKNENEKIKSLKEKDIELNGEREENISEQESLKKSLQDFVNSEIFLEYNKLIKRKEDAENSIEKTKEEITKNLEPLQIPFKKLKKTIENGKTLENLEAYINSPLISFLQDRKLNQLKKMIEKVKIELENETMEIKNREEVLEFIERLNGENILENLYQEYENMNQEMKNLENEIEQNNSLSQKSNLERELEETVEEGESIALSENRIKNQIGELETRISELKKSIEETSSTIFKKKITIAF